MLFVIAYVLVKLLFHEIYTPILKTEIVGTVFESRDDCLMSSLA